MVKTSKSYIEHEYDLAILDLQTAHNEDEQWSARKNMARLERLASSCYGLDYMDELHQKINSLSV